MLPSRLTLRLALVALTLAGMASADGGGILLVGGVPAPDSALEEATVRCAPSDFLRCVEGDIALRFALVREARARGVEKNSRFVRTEQLLLAESLERSLDDRRPDEATIAAFLGDHRREFERPLRIHAWRILVGSDAEARSLLRELGATPKPERFRQLCREKSLDKATSERGGDLGMLWPDGTTDLPQVRAEPALYEALLGASEGELLAEPVPEGRAFAVLWRRDSLPPEAWPEERRRALAIERLREKHAADARGALLRELRERSLRTHRPDLLDKLAKNLARVD